MSDIGSLECLLHEELKSLYDAETRLTKALPKMAKKATDENLRAALKAHLGETETQLERLEHALELVGEPAKARTSLGMKGVIAEGREHWSSDFDTKQLRDVAIVAAATRVEHYEIDAYATAILHAKQIGLTEVASLLEESLAEEKAANDKLAKFGDSISSAAMTTAEDEDEDDDEDDDEELQDDEDFEDDDQDDDDEDEDEDKDADDKDVDDKDGK